MNTSNTRYTLDLKSILPTLRAMITAEGELTNSPIGTGIALQVQATRNGVEYRPFRLNWLGETVHLQAPVDQYDDIFALEAAGDEWDLDRFSPEAPRRFITILEALEARWLQ